MIHLLYMWVSRKGERGQAEIYLPCDADPLKFLCSLNESMVQACPESPTFLYFPISSTFCPELPQVVIEVGKQKENHYQSLVKRRVAA